MDVVSVHTHLVWPWAVAAQWSCTFLFPPSLSLDLVNTSLRAGSTCRTFGKISHLLPWQAVSMNKGLILPCSSINFRLRSREASGTHYLEWRMKSCLWIWPIEIYLTNQIKCSILTSFKIVTLLMGLGFALHKIWIGQEVKLTSSPEGCPPPNLTSASSRRRCRLHITDTIQAQLQLYFCQIWKN